MNIFLITRKEYDIRWGEYSKELQNIRKAEEMIVAEKEKEINNKNTEIITSIFNDDAEPAKLLGRFLGIEKVKKVGWLTFIPTTKNHLHISQTSDILKKFIDEVKETAMENVIIVACRSMVAVLLKIFREDFSAEIKYNRKDAEFYTIIFM